MLLREPEQAAVNRQAGWDNATTDPVWAFQSKGIPVTPRAYSSYATSIRFCFERLNSKEADLSSEQ